MKILKLKREILEAPSLAVQFFSPPPPVGFEVYRFSAPPPSPTIFSEPPFRVSKNFWSPPQYLHSLCCVFDVSTAPPKISPADGRFWQINHLNRLHFTVLFPYHYLYLKWFVPRAHTCIKHITYARKTSLLY